MRCLSRWMLVVGVAALIASPVMAQQRGRGGFGGGGPAQLINMEPVQKELKLSEEEVTKAKETAKAVTDKHMEETQALRDLDPQERFPKQMELSAKISEETYAALAKDWKPEQIKRLKQLGVQRMGLQAFMNPAVDKVLKLTDEQKEKARSIQMETMEQSREIFGNGGDQAENAKKLAAIQKESFGKAVAMLTDDQKKEWKELTGDPFEFPAFGGPGAGKGGKGKRKKDKDN